MASKNTNKASAVDQAAIYIVIVVALVIFVGVFTW